jgi:transcriptional regulator with XRE-family HTH domain
MPSRTPQPSANVCGPQVLKYRTERKWSQAKLAEQCQIAGWDASRGIIANIELQQRLVTDYELKILARVLKTTLDALVN